VTQELLLSNLWEAARIREPLLRNLGGTALMSGLLHFSVCKITPIRGPLHSNLCEAALIRGLLHSNLCVTTLIFVHYHKMHMTNDGFTLRSWLTCLLTNSENNEGKKNTWSRDSSVSIATGYGLDSPGSITDRARFSLLHTVQTGSRVHPAPNQIGTRLPEAIYPGVKRPGSEADNSPSSIAEVENGGAIYNSIPAHVFMAL
jgi:hypothetical protein